MKRGLPAFLQLIVVLAGIGILALLLWEPHLEGVNANATSLSEIYFDDPFLWYIYVSFIAVFAALYQAFKLLGYMGRGEVFSEQGVRALRTIKYCALVFAAFIVGAELMIISQRGEDDIAGGVALGLFMIVVSLVGAAAASVFERTLQKAVDIKSENDLTV
jgi:hypothetical protein